jgi:monoamine oxidase
MDTAVDATNEARDTFVADIPVAAGPPPPSVHDAREITSTIAEIDDLSKTVPVDAPWTCPSAATWDHMTVEDYLLNKRLSPVALRELKLGVQTIIASDCKDLSFLYFLFFVHAAGGFREVSDGPGGAQDAKVKTGMQSVCERLSAVLIEKGVDLLLETPVRKIFNFSSDQVSQARVVATSKAGEVSVRATQVVVAMPPPVAGDIAILPATRRAHGSHAHGGVPQNREHLRQPVLENPANQSGPRRALFGDGTGQQCV